MYKLFAKKDLKLFVGTVVGTPRVLEREGTKTVSLVLKDYIGDQIEIFFDNASSNAPKSQMLADRIIDAKVSEGAFLSVLAESDEAEITATGKDFKYRGMWEFKEEHISVLMGVALNPRKPKDGMFCITMPIDQRVKGNNTTMWCDVTFFDTSSGEHAWKNATNASRLLCNEEKPIVVVVGSQINERIFNGKTYYSIKGYRIIKKS